MSLISKFLKVSLLLFSVHLMSAQVRAGISYGFNYDFGKETPSNYQSNNLLELSFIYENESLFNPCLSVLFSKVPLNYSDVLIKNQGNFKTAVLNNSTAVEIGLESIVKSFNKSNLTAKFGFGLNIFSNPLVDLETSNVSFGYDSYYSSNSKTKFPFLNFAIKADRELSTHWQIDFSIGTAYYIRDNELTILTQINGQDIEVNSTFTKLRPYAKLGIAYSFKKGSL